MANNLKHPVQDLDTYFRVDPVTRELSNDACLKSCLIQHDHNSERFSFTVPKIIEGHDMSMCDSIQVHYINIDSQTKEQSAGVYEVDDWQADYTYAEEILFTWLISHNATRYVGSLSFLIRFSCYHEDGTLSYVWNTAIYSGISISNGIDNGPVIIDDYADILNEWRKETLAFRLVELTQEQTSTESEGVNIWRATFADGTVRDFEVRNGAKGEKGDLPDLTNYVQKTDLAVPDGEPGLIKLPSYGTYGITIRNGVLATQGATNTHVKDLTSHNNPLTPARLTFATKVGLIANADASLVEPATTDTELTEAEQAAITAWLGASQMEVITYTGTGMSGAAHPCEVTCSFVPRLLRLLSVNGKSPYPGADYVYDTILCDRLTEEYGQDGGYFYWSDSGMLTNAKYAKKSADGKTISWYIDATTVPGDQCNASGYEYVLLAIR